MRREYNGKNDEFAELIRAGVDPASHGIFSEPGHAALCALQDMFDNTPGDQEDLRNQLLELGQELAPQIWEQISTYITDLRSAVADDLSFDCDPYIMQAQFFYVEFCRQFEVRGPEVQNNLESLLQRDRTMPLQQTGDEQSSSRQERWDAQWEVKKEWDNLSRFTFNLLADIAPEAHLAADGSSNQYLRKFAYELPALAEPYRRQVLKEQQTRIEIIRKQSVMIKENAKTKPAEVQSLLDTLIQSVNTWIAELQEDQAHFITLYAEYAGYIKYREESENMNLTLSKAIEELQDASARLNKAKILAPFFLSH